MKTCAAPAAPKVKFNMRIHMTPAKALKAKIAAMTATKAIAKAATTPKIKFTMKIHMPATDEKALKAKIKAEIAAMMATKAIAKDFKKAAAKDVKKAIVKDPKKDNANDSQEGRNDEGVLDLYIENLDLVTRDPSNAGVSSKAIEDSIEKTLSNLSIDQV